MVKYEADLDAVFMALAHPARRAMLARLGRGDATVSELAAPFSMSMPAITKHLKVMERAKLITRGRNAQWRPCRLEPAPIEAASDWIEEQRQVWEARLDRLQTYLGELQKDEGTDDGQ